MRTANRNGLIAALAVAILAIAGAAAAQQQPPVAGTQPLTIGVSVDESAVVARGWSAKKNLLGKTIYNDKNEKIGTIEDLIISPDRSASFAIVGTGGFVGLDRHDVAIPFGQLEPSANRIVLPGASKDAIKALPEFQYAK
jgi:sporulation protein YlmC with PRC-barrel domain